MPQKRTAALIRAAIGYADITREDLARRLDISTSTLDRWAGKQVGGSEPDVEQFARIVAITRLPMDLFTDDQGALGRMERRLDEHATAVEGLLTRQSAILERIERAVSTFERAVDQATAGFGPDAT